MTHARALAAVHALLLAAAAVSGCGSCGRPAEPDRQSFRDGDVLMQHIESPLCEAILDMTDSRYSHCGMVEHRAGRPFVIEAIGPVKHTPLAEWLARGVRGRYTHLRPRDLNAEQTAAALSEARRLLGRPYDLQYQMDDAKIYCSELVYKAYLRGAGVEIGRVERLGDLHWQPHEKLIRSLAGGGLPLEREMVTPESVAASPHLEEIRSTF